MFFSLFICLGSCGVVLNRLIYPREILTFTEVMTEGDQQITISLSNLKKDGALRYRILEPTGEKHRNSAEEESYTSSNESEDQFGTFLTSSSKTFTKVGTYKIQILNKSRHPSEFQISSYIYKKINETNKDVVELRNLLYSLQTAMDTLGNENYYLRTHLTNNLNEAKFIRKSMKWLIAFPIATMLIGYGKYLLSKQLVKPKGKRFRGMF
ncbi:hypothetical protein PAEPH01_0608 [Pancytospora epiphaga]|nr:hypothetical protein PAEPH01_0608 [Pancytospora epiphaga]